MTTTAQHAAPEEIMALLDGEISAAEARTMTSHIEECTECAGVADQLRETSQSLAGWTVPAAPETLGKAIQGNSRKAPHAPRLTGFGFGNWRLWALGTGAAAAVILVIVVTAHSVSTAADRDLARRSPVYMAQQNEGAAGRLAMSAPPPSAARQGFIAGAEMDALQQPAQRLGTAGMINGSLRNSAALTALPNPAAPMIARTVSLTILVKDIAASRAALDAILTRYQGYAAQLNINTPENYARSFGASLRIPAPELPTALADLRQLGRVQSESQSGEEVTQEHADLVARLKNARETEQRLLAILQQRTGKVEEVLQVEEQISNTRGEIERMEAEQKALEHRVDFATVSLQLTEEYKAQFNAPSTPVGTRMHNAFVTGLANAGGSLLGMILFFEEYGPVLLVWLAVLGVPVVLLWRRYRRAQTRI